MRTVDGRFNSMYTNGIYRRFTWDDHVTVTVYQRNFPQRGIRFDPSVERGFRQVPTIGTYGNADGYIAPGVLSRSARDF